VLRTKVDSQETLWKSPLSEEFRRLSPGLSSVDAYLHDPVFFEPFVAYFDPEFGRNSIPIEIYICLMYLRFRYNLGFETLCAEVVDSLSWRRFCRIGPYDKVPDPSTLMKITKRCGDDIVSQLNAALLKKADSDHLVKLDKVRADTTVVPANVAYPTDAGAAVQRRHQARPQRLGLEITGLRLENEVPRPDKIGPPPGAVDRGVAAPAQRRGQSRGARDHGPAGRHRRAHDLRRPGDSPQRQADALPGREVPFWKSCRPRGRDRGDCQAA